MRGLPGLADETQLTAGSCPGKSNGRKPGDPLVARPWFAEYLSRLQHPFCIPSFLFLVIQSSSPGSQTLVGRLCPAGRVHSRSPSPQTRPLVTSSAPCSHHQSYISGRHSLQSHGVLTCCLRSPSTRCPGTASHPPLSLSLYLYSCPYLIIILPFAAALTLKALTVTAAAPPGLISDPDAFSYTTTGRTSQKLG